LAMTVVCGTVRTRVVQGRKGLRATESKS
jgi:hypothetical protein